MGAPLQAAHPPRPAFACDRRFALLAALGVALLIALGCWQLERAERKEELLLLAEQRSAQAPLALASLRVAQPAAVDRMPLALSGHWIEGRDFLLDNRVSEGRAGYELLSPFRDDSGLVVFVNRGWIAAPPTRDRLPAVATPPGRHELRAVVQAVVQGTEPLPDTAGWPRRVQAVEPRALAALAGLEAVPYLARLPTPGAAAGLPARLAPEHHRASALQWFLMAFALGVVFVCGGTNVASWLWPRGRERMHP